MRVTIDIDRKSRRRLRKVYRRLIKLTGKAPKVYLSAFRKGYHLIVSDINISYKESLKMRLKCGDDVKRLYFDMEADGKPRQILWSRKEILFSRSGEYKEGVVERIRI